MNPSWPKPQSLCLWTVALLRLSPPLKLCPIGLAAERMVRLLLFPLISPSWLVWLWVLSLYWPLMAPTAAPTWADTTTTDQSETVSEAPSTPVSDPVPPRTPRANAGGRKHHFVPKTVSSVWTCCCQSEASYIAHPPATTLQADLKCWKHYDLKFFITLFPRWSSLNFVCPVEEEQSSARCTSAARTVGWWPTQSVATAAPCRVILLLLTLPSRLKRYISHTTWCQTSTP